jgi:O-antigen/teichoic acid export membrane protein
VSAPEQSLGRSSVKNVMWNGATFGLSKGVVLVTTIILARLLPPEDFGLLAISLVVIGYLDFINDFGISAAVIQHDGDPDETADTAFWINLALGVALAGLGYVTAPLFASFFNEPRATELIRVLSLSFPITSIGAIHEARLRRELRFSRRVIPEFLKGVAKGAVSITLALLGYGVWSLAWGQLAGALAASLAYWFAYRWLPRFRLSWKTSRSLLGFGATMTSVGLLGGLHKNLDYLVVGRRLGSRELGLYTMAFRIPQLLIESFVDISGQVAFPAFSRVRSQPDRVRGGLQRMLRLIGIVIVPVGLGVALTADPFVRVFYGERWVDAIPVMQVLAISILVQSMSKTCGDVYKAMGRPGILNRLAIVKLAVSLPLLVFAVQYGIVAVALALLVSATILTTLRLILAARVVDVPFRDVITPFIPSVRAGVIMAGACLLVALPLTDTAAVIQLLGITAAGAVVYPASLWIFDRGVINEVRSITRRSGVTA